MQLLAEFLFNQIEVIIKMHQMQFHFKNIAELSLSSYLYYKIQLIYNDSYVNKSSIRYKL